MAIPRVLGWRFGLDKVAGDDEVLLDRINASLCLQLNESWWIFVVDYANILLAKRFLILRTIGEAFSGLGSDGVKEIFVDKGAWRGRDRRVNIMIRSW